MVKLIETLMMVSQSKLYSVFVEKLIFSVMKCCVSARVIENEVKTVYPVQLSCGFAALDIDCFEQKLAINGQLVHLIYFCFVYQPVHPSVCMLLVGHSAVLDGTHIQA